MIIALPGCQERCGGILIPYPFGIGRNFSLSEEFNVTCKTFNNGTSIPYSYLHEVEILNIDHTLGQGRIISHISSRCYNTTTKQEDSLNWGMQFGDIPFWINTEKNKFIVTGCNTLAYLCLNTDFSDINKEWQYCNSSSIDYSVGCLSSCDSRETLIEHGSSSCSGIGCCQTTIPKGTSSFLFSFDERINRSEVYNFNRCSFAMLVEEAKFNFSTAYVTNDELLDNPTLPMVINWAIGNGNTTCEHAQTDKSSYACISSNSNCTTISGRGYRCSCSNGYEGNPYLDGGCQGLNLSSVNSCFVFFLYYLYIYICGPL
ncbi:Wall-associated receptor kinase 2 [Carex littledalei]|uniref:Wall-associated receptor kinase 2 n=1 Tax=Carex littledalei TaxID=544730 RepID=A0A833RFI7_9POAL|nr:Wall-associated receptor kinase 2 [Carex littledalei]